MTNSVTQVKIGPPESRKKTNTATSALGYIYGTDDPVNGKDPDGNFTCPVCAPPPEPPLETSEQGGVGHGDPETRAEQRAQKDFKR
jgi:hypothetical protein